ncbi:SocA family protein [Candidatus Woesebacteria bacterium]|nr:SocA family protein [Candidatus Woesebacteria bacterium]
MTTLSVKNTSKVFQIANYFIKKAQEENKELTNKKLQKLLYYSQAWSVTLRDKSIFEDNIEAWVHGPAIRSVYHRFSDFGRENLASKVDVTSAHFDEITTDDKELLNKIWEIYGKYTANDLEVISHSESPWQDAREGLEPYEASANIITIESMKQYYGQRQKEAKSSS